VYILVLGDTDEVEGDGVAAVERPEVVCSSVINHVILFPWLRARGAEREKVGAVINSEYRKVRIRISLEERHLRLMSLKDADYTYNRTIDGRGSRQMQRSGDEGDFRAVG